jgi:hypothetical protein
MEGGPRLQAPHPPGNIFLLPASRGPASFFRGESHPSPEVPGRKEGQRRPDVCVPLRKGYSTEVGLPHPTLLAVAILCLVV